MIYIERKKKIRETQFDWKMIQDHLIPGSL